MLSLRAHLSGQALLEILLQEGGQPLKKSVLLQLSGFAVYLPLAIPAEARAGSNAAVQLVSSGIRDSSPASVSRNRQVPSTWISIACWQASTPKTARQLLDRFCNSAPCFRQLPPDLIFDVVALFPGQFQRLLSKAPPLRVCNSNGFSQVSERLCCMLTRSMQHENCCLDMMRAYLGQVFDASSQVALLPQCCAQQVASLQSKRWQ